MNFRNRTVITWEISCTCFVRIWGRQIGEKQNCFSIDNLPSVFNFSALQSDSTKHIYRLICLCSPNMGADMHIREIQYLHKERQLHNLIYFSTTAQKTTVFLVSTYFYLFSQQSTKCPFKRAPIAKQVRAILTPYVSRTFFEISLA